MTVRMKREKVNDKRFT